MKVLLAILSFFGLGIQQLPPGMSPSKTATWGLFALMNNINAYAEGLATIVTAGTNSTLTAAQVLAKNIILTAGASGGFTITLPTTAAILSALNGPGEPCIPTDGTFYFPLYIVNQGVGQIGTVTAGDASTTVAGTATIADSVSAKFMVQVVSATTLLVTRVLSADS